LGFRGSQTRRDRYRAGTAHPYQTHLYRIGRYRERWGGHKAEYVVVHLRRLVREGEELREKQRRRELVEDGTKQAQRTASKLLTLWMMTYMDEPAATP
jgi:hypothetical protein